MKVQKSPAAQSSWPNPAGPSASRLHGAPSPTAPVWGTQPTVLFCPSVRSVHFDAAPGGQV